jgi:hypothetical protein
LTPHRSIGGWQLREPFPGIYLWRAPHGSIFLVDHTGTRKITDPWHQAAGTAPALPMEQRLAALVLGS